MTHYVYMFESGGRSCWECSCGSAGSSGEFIASDIAASRHIKEGEQRVDISKPRW